MELINRNYVKCSKNDIFILMNKYIENGEYDIIYLCHKMIDSINDYERKNNFYVRDFYVGTDAPIFNDDLFIQNLPIKRDSIANAYFYSCLNGIEIDHLYLKYLLPKKEILAYQLGDMLDYVLDNSISISEFYDGEEEKIIYNCKDNCVEKGYVFLQTNKNIKTK